MSAIKKTLHLFGGGPLVKLSEKIAYDNNWNVVLRTGKRFIKSLPKMDQKTKILVGNNLMDLIMESDEPKLGDIGLSISAPWIFKKNILISFMVGSIIFIINHCLNLKVQVVLPGES